MGSTRFVSVNSAQGKRLAAWLDLCYLSLLLLAEPESLYLRRDRSLKACSEIIINIRQRMLDENV